MSQEARIEGLVVQPVALLNSHSNGDKQPQLPADDELLRDFRRYFVLMSVPDMVLNKNGNGNDL